MHYNFLGTHLSPPPESKLLQGRDYIECFSPTKQVLRSKCSTNLTSVEPQVPENLTVGLPITDWTPEKEDATNQEGEWLPGPLVQGTNGHPLFFCWFPDTLCSLPPPGLLHTTVCVMLKRWSEGSCRKVFVHTCNSGKEIPEPLLLLLRHLTPSPVIGGSFEHLCKNAPAPSFLTCDLVPG